jgi:type IV secretion system protein VirD4
VKPKLPLPKPENPKKKKILALTGIAMGIGLTLTVATQTFARDVGYNPALGNAISQEMHVYYPWAIVDWHRRYFQKQPELFNGAFENGKIAFMICFMLGLVGGIASSQKLKGVENLHGSARWATTKEVYQAGLLHKPKKNGEKEPPYVYVGAYEEKKGKVVYLKHSGPEHVLTYAPTRSGKGVGLVIPTLLSWYESAVITDLKGELWALTAGYRSSGLKNNCIKFEPASKESAHWNPLDEIRLGTENEIGDAQNLANMIVDPEGKGLEGQDAHWKKTAFALYVGLILHVLYLRKHEGTPASMLQIDNLLSDPNRDIKELWSEMINYPHLGEKEDQSDWKPHPVISAAAKDQLDRPDEEAGSVLSTVKSNLALFRDNIVSENTSDSDFHVRDIMNCKDPMSVYIVTQPADKTRLKPLVRMFVNMTVRVLAGTEGLKFVDGRAVCANKHRLLMMLDEFPSLGKLDIMQESLAFVAGYGIKCYLICQDLSQLKSEQSGYGHEESITSNCHIQNAYPPNRPETAEYLSKLTGTATILKESVTKSGNSIFSSNTSRTIQETQRPLLTPDECLRLSGPKKNDKGDITEAGDMLVFVAGFPAIYGKQPLYFKDPVFLKRSKMKAPEEYTVHITNEMRAENNQIQEPKIRYKKITDRTDKKQKADESKEFQTRFNAEDYV